MRIAECGLRIADAIVSVVLAPACAACEQPLEHPTLGPVCDRCWQSIRALTPPLCDRCGDPLPAWRVVSVPLGVIGTIWAAINLRELVTLKKGQRLDLLGNATFLIGILGLLIGLTQGGIKG